MDLNRREITGRHKLRVTMLERQCRKIWKPLNIKYSTPLCK